MPESEDSHSADRADAVRTAAVHAIQSTAGYAGLSRERAQELADELGQAAGRLMGAFDELRPASADDVRALRARLAVLERRIDALEAGAAQTPRRTPGRPDPQGP
jgi:hypothetical protein